MEVEDIGRMGVRLGALLSEFDDCFGRSEPREHLCTYVNGQVARLHRKSVEPIALAAGTPVRTLQGFFERTHWDELRLRDRLQRIVARDHADGQAIGVIDEEGQPKKGRHTAGVQHQWCGRTGKVDNCIVSVHLSYVAGDFECLLDSDLFLPQAWAEDQARRREAHIPDEVVFRTKLQIALEQVRRALGNGIRVAMWTFDAFYGRDSAFLDGLEELGQNYVAQVPCDFTGWLHEPRVLLRPTPRDMRRGGRRRYPRLARQALPACEVQNLVRYSRVFTQQPWMPWRVRDGERGPMVWEVKHAPFYRKHSDGLPGRMHYLIVARNVLNTEEVKYFVANGVPGRKGVTLGRLLKGGFSRWPIERVFQQAKDELGLDHVEMRGWRAIHRHLYITQLTHLFCARERQRLREKKRKNNTGLMSDRGTSAPGGVGLGRGAEPDACPAPRTVSEDSRYHRLLSAAQP